MKNYLRLSLLVLTGCCFATLGACQKKSTGLKVVIIRHGEKPKDGDNLNCQGFNRSLALPKVLFGKFGTASTILVPTVKAGIQTKQSRMFQTISPYAVKYAININSSYDDNDVKDVAADVKSRTGVVILVWEHNNIPKLAKALGVQNVTGWPNSDFDSIWVVTYDNGTATLTKDTEGLKPSPDCSF